MKIIGITGGVGAGKSKILQYFSEHYQARVIEADKVGHLLMEPGGSSYYGIVEKFGSQILNGDQTINREMLGKIVFSDKKRLEELNRIVHPQVKEYISAEIERERAKGKVSLLVVEAALLIEDHYDVICDELWYIDTSSEVRIQRLKKSRNYSDEKIAGIMANQKSKEEFEKHCQVVIDNSHTLTETYEQIDRRMKE